MSTFTLTIFIYLTLGFNNTGRLTDAIEPTPTEPPPPSPKPGFPTVNGRIKITIGVTSGCIESQRLITTQLADSYKEYRRFLDIVFVIWGKSYRSITDIVRCQYGLEDCWANRLQRCVLKALKGKQDAQMTYMFCEYSSPYPSFKLNEYGCARSAGLQDEDINVCMCYTATELEEAAEYDATETIKKIDSVPTVVFNDNINVELHDEVVKKFRMKNMICLSLANDLTTGIYNSSCVYEPEF